MSKEHLNNKRIAKNTLLLYIRMFVLMGVSLYTGRIVLSTLGIDDFGIYNVVGGFVMMFGFLNVAMSACTQRYIAFSLGKGDFEKLKTVFSSCVLTHALIALIILVCSETIGLWFLYNKMVIPVDRMDAAFWVFQCSVFSAIVLIMSVPYNADIIAHEKMSAFAYISVLEAVLKLVIVYLLMMSSYDKLILYAILLCVVQVFIRFVYIRYCHSHFSESKFHWIWDKDLFKEMLSYAGWNLFGGISNILYTHGLNLLLNIFFGPAVNAARGVAVHVQQSVVHFSHNFQMALNPQITKLYAANDLAAMHRLVFRSAKYTFILLFILSFPLCYQAEFILSVWLKEVPEWTVAFVRIMLCTVVVDAMANPFMTSVAATGKVKKYQITIGGLMILIVPISYGVLKMGAPPFAVFLVHLGMCIITYIIRLFFVKALVEIDIGAFLKEVIFRCLIIGAISGAFVYLIDSVLILESYILSSIVKIFICGLVVAITSFVFGLTQSERTSVTKKMREIYKKKFQK